MERSMRHLPTTKPVTALTGRFSFIAAGLPLCIYPLMLSANLMTFAGLRNQHDPLPLTVVIYMFIAASTLYPAVFLFCLVTFFVTKNEKRKAASVIAAYAYLLFCILLFLLWFLM